MEKVVYPMTERQRTLQSLPFSENDILTRQLPTDTVLKGLQLRLNGSVTTTFGSGTPVADAFSTFDNIIPRIDVTVNGSRVVKSVRPHMMRMQQILLMKIQGERRASAGAAAVYNPTVDGGFTYGTTTQITTVAETIYVPFEQLFCDLGTGREQTWLNLKGVSSAELKLTTTSFSKLLGFGNTAPVVFSSSTMKIDIFTIEAQDVPANVLFADWKQTTKELTFSAETTDYPIDINTGNRISAIHLLARDGAAGSSTTATGKLASNNALTRLGLKVNGQTSIKETSFLALQNENRARFGVNAPMGTNVSIFDGYACMNLLARNDINTALPAMKPLVDQVQLYVNTNNSSNVSYTNPVSVTVMTDEIVRQA